MRMQSGWNRCGVGLGRGAGVQARAFTLVELLLVLVILAVLAMVVVPKFTGRSEQARETAARTDISNIDTALGMFEVDNGRYPTTDEWPTALFQRPGNARVWNGPYLKKQPVDPWGNPYVYRYPGTRVQGEPDLYSLGADGREGNDDIGNWEQ